MPFGNYSLYVRRRSATQPSAVMNTEYFTDIAGTIPAKIGQPVALMKVHTDSGETVVYEQPTCCKRPTLKQFPDGVLPDFDPVDDVLVLRR